VLGEYGLIIALVVIACIVVVAAIGAITVVPYQQILAGFT